MSRRILPIFALACSATTEPGTTDAPDLIAECSAGWPAHTCDGGCGDAVAQRWAEGYLDHVDQVWGTDRAITEQHIEVWAVRLEGTPTQYATLQVVFVSGWVAALYEVRASLPSPPTTSAEARAAFAGLGAPQVDPFDAPRPWSEVSAFVDDCAATHGVTFGDWCRAYITQDPDDDDQTGVRFDFEADLDGSRYAYAVVYAFGHEPDRCDTNAYLTD